MSVYSPYEGYPRSFDEIDDTMCDTCPHRFHECWDEGYCLVDEGDQDE